MKENSSGKQIYWLWLLMLLVRSVAVSFFVFITGCVSVQPPMNVSAEAVSKKSVIIVVPGYYGTALANAKTGERLHITFGKAVFGGPTLAFNSESLDIPDGVEARPDGVLRSLTIFSGIYSIDIHQALFEYLDAQFPTARIIAFPYDWRGSNAQSAQELGKLVEEVRLAGAEKIRIVAFSNGGVVTSYYLRYGGQSVSSAKENWRGARRIDGAVLVGSPFKGTMQAFYNAQYGVRIGLARGPLNAIAMSTFPSLYELLPAMSEGAFLNKTGRSVSEGIYTPEYWKKNSWGLFNSVEPMSEETQLKRKQFLAESLNSGTAFSEKLLAVTKNPLERKLPTLVVLGKGVRTIEKAKWSAEGFDGKALWDFSDPSLFAEGDGTVTYRSAMPPSAYEQSLQIERAELEFAHSEMVRNPDVLSRIGTFLAKQGF